MNKPSFTILPFVLLSVLALITGLWAGLIRIGVPVPTPFSTLPVQHGPLMISGFLGTLIALERVAALRKKWMLAAPLLSGLGWIMGLALPGIAAVPLLITLGSLVNVAILSVIFLQESKIYTAAMAAGALCWLGGNILWLTRTPIPMLVWWWAAFLVLTIAGERLELSRVVRLKPYHHWLFGLSAVIFLTGILLSAWFPQVAAPILGAGLLAMCAWLMVYDIARRILRHPIPLTRFIATSLFSGYLWLGLSGGLLLWHGYQTAGFLYDAVLHAIFVGFVFAMIFGHAPIILPALTRIQVPFHKGFYLPLALLHISLLLRMSGNLTGWHVGRMWGGIMNEVAILSFIGLLISSVVRQKRAEKAFKKTEKAGEAQSLHPIFMHAKSQSKLSQK